MLAKRLLKERARFKRGLGILLAVALTLSTVTCAIPAAKAAGTAVDYRKAQMGAKVLPAQAAGNDSFLAAYVLQERLGSYGVNGLFQKTASHNLRHATDTLSRTTKYWHNSNDDWYTEFCWNFPADSAVKKLWNAGGLALNFSGNLYSDYHRNLGKHTSELWDRVQLKISGLNSEGEKLLHERLSEKKDDQQAQPYTASVRPGGNQNTGIKFWAGSYNCECGSSGVGDSVLYLVDDTAPKITQVYAASDREGENRLTGDKGLKAGQQVYFILEFSEDVRFADDQRETLDLALDCAWKTSDQSVQETVKASLVSAAGSRMVFEMSVPSTLDGQATDIYVDSISSNQSWVGKSSQFPWVLLDENSNTLSVQDGMLDNIGSRITDMAGNPINWTDSKKQLSERAYLDTVSPALQQVTISGSKIKKASETPKQDGGWPADMDLSAVYAANGDQLTFGVWFTERVTGLDVTKIEAALNLVNGGSPVKLKAKQLVNVTGKSAFGVDASNSYVSELIFEPLTLTAGMTWTADEEGPIRITGISGMDGAKDIVGNALGQIADIPAPRQQQYLDVTAPRAETTLQMENDKYIPLGSASGYQFTVPIKVIDEGSGSTNLTGRFQLGTSGATENTRYFWYIDTNPNFTSGRNGAQSYMGETNKFTQLGSGMTSYLHIRAVSDQAYLTADGCFDETLTVSVADYAGNTSTTSFPLRHQVDKIAPGVQASEYTPTVSYVSGTDYTVAMNLKISVTDSFSIRSISYFWEDEGSGTQTPVTPTGKETEFTVNRSFPVSLASGSQVSGKKTLHVLVTDEMGNSQDWTRDFAYEAGRGKSIYTVYNGSADDPQFTPLLKMEHPKDVNMNGAESRVDSIMLLKIDDNNYYAFLPYLGEAAPTAGEIDPLNEFFSDSAQVVSTGKWYKFEIRLDGDKLDVENDTAQFTRGSEVDAAAIKNFITNRYGPLNVYFLASPELVMADGAIKPTVNLSQDKGTIDHEIIYMAAGFDPTDNLSSGYNAVIADVLDADDHSVKQKMTHPSAANGTVGSMEEVGFQLKIENLRDSASAPYGTSLIDFSNRGAYPTTYFTLQYSKENKEASFGDTAYSYVPLTEAKEQILALPDSAGDSSGWYRFKFHFMLKDGTTEWEQVSQPFYIDKTESSAPFLSAYEKSCTQDGGSGKTLEMCSNTYQQNEQPAQLNIGLAEVPEGWTAHQQLTFKVNYQPDPMQKTDVDGAGLGGALRIRVFSRKDEAGETNAPWVTVAPEVNQYSTTYLASFTPVLAEEIAAASYADNRLPLVEGENIVCCQVMNPNGIIKTTELHVQVSVKAPDSITWQETGRTERETTLKPVLTDQQALENWTIGVAGKLYTGESDTPGPAAGYRFKAVTSRPVEFYVYDAAYGNLSLSSTEVTGVDGFLPTLDVYSRGSGYNSEGLYNTNLTITDDSVSLEEVPTVTVTFDAADSVRILGRPLANEEERVSAEVPVLLESFDKVQLNCQPYQGYNPSNQGIYCTQVFQFKEAERSFELDVTGAFPFDETVAEGTELSHVLTFTVTDKNGNRVSKDCSITAQNHKPNFIWPSLNDDNLLEAFSCYPVSAVHSYGAGSFPITTSTTTWGSAAFNTVLPMIHCDGTYTLDYTDLFGKHYSQKLEVSNVFGSSEVALDVSEKNYTKGPVTVTATVQSAPNCIVSMSAVDEAGQPLATGVLGKPDEDGRILSAYLVMPENGKVTVTTTMTTDTDYRNTCTLNITNIDTELAPAVVFFDYNGMTQPTYVDGTADTVEGEVTAVLSCEEFVTGTNGPLTYTFKAGGARGDTYTFAYADQAGNAGEMTATLPVNIREKEAPPVGQQDATAPNYTVNCYGQRDEYAYQGDYTYRPDEADDPALLQTEAAEAVSAICAAYPARGYSLLFNVEDDSDVKLLLREKNGPAPTSYEDASSTVEGVSVAGSTVTVTENTAFDLYLVDAKSNITPIRGIEITALDNEPPAVTVRNEPVTGEDGFPTVRSYFDVENDEQIFVTDSRLGVEAKVESTQVGYNTVYKTVRTYYYDHAENGDYVFYYRDIYGNLGTAKATATGIDNAKPIVNYVKWYGTPDNRAPDAQDDRRVNHDVTAEITVSKSVKQAELFTADGTDQRLGDDQPVSVSWVGQKVTVTYGEDLPEIMVKITSASGRSTTHTLPEVGCIDKIAPVVTDDGGTLANNRRSKTYTFTTDEPTTFAEGDMAARTAAATEHTWTAAQSGKVTLHFADKAGNVCAHEVNVTDVDSARLTLRFNTTASGEGAKTKDKISELELKAGDTLYVSADKEATLNLGTDITAAADTWTQFTLPNTGGFHVLKATDTSTKESTYVTLLVTKTDAAPPIILFHNNTVTLTEGLTAEEMNEKVREGVTVTDTVDSAPAFTVTGTPSTAEKGVYTLTYTATDAAGNQATATRTLYIVAENAPTITLNGQLTQPFDTAIIQGSTLEVKVNMDQPVVVKVKKGVKTSGQMKYGAATLQADADGLMTAELALGYYTVYIRTQDRQEVIAYVYRDE